MPLAAAIYMHSPWTPASVVVLPPAGGPWARRPEPPFPRELLEAVANWLEAKIEGFDKRKEAYDRLRERRRIAESAGVDGVRDEDGGHSPEVEALMREFAHLKRQMLRRGGEKDEENK